MSRKAPVCAHVSTSTYTHVDVLEGGVHTVTHVYKQGHLHSTCSWLCKC